MKQRYDVVARDKMKESNLKTNRPKFIKNEMLRKFLFYGALGAGNVIMIRAIIWAANKF